MGNNLPCLTELVIVIHILGELITITMCACASAHTHTHTHTHTIAAMSDMK